MYIKTPKPPTFNDALLTINNTDFFILKKDLICENGIFKAGTRVRLSTFSRSLHSAEYLVESADAEDKFSLTDDFTNTEIQDFFENTFMLDEISKSNMEQVLEEYNFNTDNLYKKMLKLRIGFVIVSAILFLWAFFMLYFNFFNSAIIEITIFILVFLDVGVSFLLSPMEDKKSCKMQNTLKETIATILKGDDM